LLDVAAALPSVLDLAESIEQYGPDLTGAEVMELAYVVRQTLLDLIEGITRPTVSPAYPVSLADWLKDEGAEEQIRTMVAEGLERRLAHAGI